MLNGDDLYLFFKMADSTKLENKRLYNPMLYELKRVFDPSLV